MLERSANRQKESLLDSNLIKGGAVLTAVGVLIRGLEGFAVIGLGMMAGKFVQSRFLNNKVR